MKTVSIVFGAIASTMCLFSGVFLLIFSYSPSTITYLSLYTDFGCLGAALLGIIASLLILKNKYVFSGILFVICAVISILCNRLLASFIFPLAAIITFTLPFSSSNASFPKYKTIVIIAGALSVTIAIGVMFFGYISGIFENETIPRHREWLEKVGSVMLLLGALSCIGSILGIIGGIIGLTRRRLSSTFLITAAVTSLFTIAGIVSSLLFFVSHNLLSKQSQPDPPLQ